ncbi:hypothetical protein [Maricaulis parjimensis]|uniref:hypothetical protein n=1 Tax=Maricaulis parjimensis TaxID=144023 RepID=UPI0019392D9D|nr:hypothetical protein [Maricaulis parjimensis]
MKIPFALWSGILALGAYGAMVALSFRDFGYLDPVWDKALLIGGVWIGLVVLVSVISALRKAFTSRPADIPMDVAEELDNHPQ